MNRIISAALIFALLFALGGCGKKTAPEPAPESGEPPVSAPSQPPVLTRSEAAKRNAKIPASDVHIIQFDDPDEGEYIATIKTSEGDIKVRLFYRQAPQTVEEFVRLAKDGYYNGQKFHTIVNGYKVEGGSAKTVSEFPDEPEFSLDLWNFRGAVALTGNAADFMIVQANHCLNPEEELMEAGFPQKVIDKYREVGGAPHQDWVTPVFGAVLEGMDVVDKIAATPLDDDEKPVSPVIISEITIEEV